MRANTELFSLADPVFFDHPARWNAERPAFALATGPVPAGWRRGERDGWVSLSPIGCQLPWQGWKIHVSSTPEAAERCLAKASALLTDEGVAFKFLRSPALVRAVNLKYAARSSSGKFITVYPSDLSVFEELLPALASALDGLDGPYILSDQRFRNGPVFARYGGFRSRFCYRPDGERCLAVEQPDGVLVPDERAPGAVAPNWAESPKVLRDTTIEAGDGPVTEFPYRVESALHFSNGGGVYLARTRSADGAGTEVILKEARPLAGCSGDGVDAVTRLRKEAAALLALHEVPGVPGLLGEHQVWEHHFIAVEKMPGITLQAWVASNNPLIGFEPNTTDCQAYTRRAARVLTRLRGVVDRVHRAGYVVGDVHPANIMVDADDQVSLVDFEAAVPVEAAVRQHNGHAGFVDRTAKGFEIDERAIDVVALWLLLPMTELLALDPGRRPALTQIALQHFPSAAAWLPQQHAAEPDNTSTRSGTAGAGRPDRRGRPLAAAKRTGPADASLGPDLGSAAARAAMAEALRMSMTLDRADRLFPGDFIQFEPGQAAAFGHGAAGVLWSLRLTGHPAPDGAVEWLRRRAFPPGTGPGFMDGSAGVAYVLAQLGCTETADSLLDSSLSQAAAVTDVSLHSGLAGIGWALLHTQAGDAAERLTAAKGLGDRLIALIDDGLPHGVDVPSGSAGRPADAGTNAGLLRGWSGVALFLQHLQATTGEWRWGAAATRAVRRDLALCVRAHNGTLQVDGGFRSWPYLEVGSAGIALVLDELIAHQLPGSPQHRQELAELHAELPLLAAALRSTFVIDAHLRRGRAGLMAAAARLAQTRPELGTAELAANHLSRLRWHAIDWRGALAFPADGLHRLSMDYLTGTAGVLAAVTATVDPTKPFLPFFDAAAGQIDPQTTGTGTETLMRVGAGARAQLPVTPRPTQRTHKVLVPADGPRRETSAGRQCVPGVPTEPV
ncbi:class III lanthionine synthetase LanKC [Nakamurella aerolata]|uniref:Protein kinase/lanthionine synthetase C family protein n=1 Tax=Nakamurella aerolata TaxID=1656892 RepID=A0A849AE06_9ACTN|nr:class III lanthionine synthetase LanKC [Nakamurella aerolata]NNG36690.1 protein kinase/lanthionine synthetase C family protein [Nakamurella aerolata]